MIRALLRTIGRIGGLVSGAYLAYVAVRGSRLALAATVLRQLETALDLLGIDTPERM